MPKYIAQRGGGPIVNWGLAAPRQSRAADATALGQGYEDYPGGQLINIDGQPARQAMGCGACRGGMGSLSGTSLSNPTISMPLPRAGAPEPLPTLGAYESTGGFRRARAMGGVVDTFAALSTPAKIGIGIAAYFLGKKLLKK